MKKFFFVLLLLMLSSNVAAERLDFTGLNFIDEDTGFCHYVVYETKSYKLIFKKRIKCADVKKEVPLVKITGIRDLITYIEEGELDPPLCFELTAVSLGNGMYSELSEHIPCEDVPKHLRQKTISEYVK